MKFRRCSSKEPNTHHGQLSNLSRELITWIAERIIAIARTLWTQVCVITTLATQADPH